MLSKRGRDIPSCAPLPTDTEDKQQDKASTKPKPGVCVRSIHKEKLLRCKPKTLSYVFFCFWMCDVLSSCLDFFGETGICNTDRHQICSSDRSAEPSILSLEI